MNTANDGRGGKKAQNKEETEEVKKEMSSP
jgi:hypothetical protein